MVFIRGECESELHNSMEDKVYEEKLDEVMLPGFRFHPTDEELLAFYLRRKIQQRPISIDLIKQLDIYKYDPWDLPKLAGMGEKEWYFYCPRDRKYRNSMRPNRVTKAGFWKATGTDRPIYSSDGSRCIGLKKSLVFYRGRAAKGTKTDWMMHEFRLPSNTNHSIPVSSFMEARACPTTDSLAICRIFKKPCSVPCRATPQYTPLCPSNLPSSATINANNNSITTLKTSKVMHSNRDFPNSMPFYPIADKTLPFDLSMPSSLYLPPTNHLLPSVDSLRHGKSKCNNVDLYSMLFGSMPSSTMVLDHVADDEPSTTMDMLHGQCISWRNALFASSPEGTTNEGSLDKRSSVMMSSGLQRFGNNDGPGGTKLITLPPTVGTEERNEAWKSWDCYPCELASTNNHMAI
ncbi:hypothetical protein Droror1_Dr00003494 [Drosera rotundifolia]